jgi:hypothetical protein
VTVTKSLARPPVSAKEQAHSHQSDTDSDFAKKQALSQQSPPPPSGETDSNITRFQQAQLTEQAVDISEGKGKPR